MIRSLLTALLLLALACDSKGARGEECTPSTSDVCEVGLVCAAVATGAKSTCEKPCSQAANDAGISECASTEACTQILGGTQAVCIAK